MSVPKTFANRIHELEPGILHWSIHDERIDSRSDSYAIDLAGGSVVIDPLPIEEPFFLRIGHVKAILLTGGFHQRAAWDFPPSTRRPGPRPEGRPGARRGTGRLVRRRRASRRRSDRATPTGADPTALRLLLRKRRRLGSALLRRPPDARRRRPVPLRPRRAPGRPRRIPTSEMLRGQSATQWFFLRLDLHPGHRGDGRADDDPVPSQPVPSRPNDFDHLLPGRLRLSDPGRAGVAQPAGGRSQECLAAGLLVLLQLPDRLVYFGGRFRLVRSVLGNWSGRVGRPAALLLFREALVLLVGLRLWWTCGDARRPLPTPVGQESARLARRAVVDPPRAGLRRNDDRAWS